MYNLIKNKTFHFQNITFWKGFLTTFKELSNLFNIELHPAYFYVHKNL